MFGGQHHEIGKQEQGPYAHHISWYTPWIPPSIAVLLRLRATRYALCVHSFSFPFFLPPPSSLQIIQSSLTTKTSELPIPTVGNLLVHMSYIGTKTASPVVHSGKFCRRGDIRLQRQQFWYNGSESIQ